MPLDLPPTYRQPMDRTKVLFGKSCHSAAILATPPSNYFGLTRQGSYLNEWAESQNCTFTGHWGIKTACI